MPLLFFLSRDLAWHEMRELKLRRCRNERAKVIWSLDISRLELPIINLHSKLAKKAQVHRIRIEIVTNFKISQIWKLYNLQKNQLLDRRVTAIGNFRG
jgi:hypothetical protein